MCIRRDEVAGVEEADNARRWQPRVLGAAEAAKIAAEMAKRAILTSRAERAGGVGHERENQRD
jgi:hypothetical protein